jgi:hypothetical protein
MCATVFLVRGLAFFAKNSLRYIVSIWRSGAGNSFSVKNEHLRSMRVWWWRSRNTCPLDAEEVQHDGAFGNTVQEIRTDIEQLLQVPYWKRLCDSALTSLDV